jgi:hypothetical protein
MYSGINKEIEKNIMIEVIWRISAPPINSIERRIGAKMIEPPKSGCITIKSIGIKNKMDGRNKELS